MKTILTVIMALMTLMANAQKWEGIYGADQRFRDMANEYVKNMDIDLGMDVDFTVDFSMFFLNDEINLIIGVDAQLDRVNAECSITFIGKYTRQGDRVECTFSKDNMSVTLDNLESTDPQIVDAINNDEDTVFGMAESMLDEIVQPHADKLFKICEFCKTFNVKNETDTSFTAVFENGFDVIFSKPAQ